MAKVYMIRNQQGLFSTGGTSPRFTKDGNIWSKRSHMLNHLGIIINSNKPSVYDGCEVVEFELVESSVLGVLADLDAIKRKHQLNVKYGRSFTKLLEKLEEGDATDKYPYVVIIKHYGDQLHVKEILKSSDLKRNQYRKVGDDAYAFANVDHATLLKLSCKDVICINVRTMTEEF